VARYTLVVGTRNWSSWSLRPFVALKATGAPYEIIDIRLRQFDAPTTREQILKHSPAGKVPVLKIAENGTTLTIWDSLAICEVLAERHPEAGLWPHDSGTRGIARCTIAARTPTTRGAANAKSAALHNEGTETRNYTSYNFEVLRDDIYMLGVDGTVTGNRIAPTRSACAVVVSSQNANRDWLYYQQQTISAEGLSGFGFSSYYPHTVRAKETKTCTSCHVSREGNNNAWMAQLLMQGTNLMNMMGRYVFVAEGSKGFDAVTVAEHDDPPAVFGSDLQKIAYPATFAKIEKHEREIDEADHHAGNVLDLQLRGEYLYAALGKGGLRIYDVANIDNKNLSEKMTTAPVSPLGQSQIPRARLFRINSGAVPLMTSRSARLALCVTSSLDAGVRVSMARQLPGSSRTYPRTGSCATSRMER